MKIYDSKCPVGRAMNVVGDRWTIMILRDLFLHDDRRFQDFLESLPGLSPNTLSTRLKTLEDDGVVDRTLYSQHPPRASYQLTSKGRELGPVMKALYSWGKKYDVTADSGDLG